MTICIISHFSRTFANIWNIFKIVFLKSRGAPVSRSLLLLLNKLNFSDFCTVHNSLIIFYRSYKIPLFYSVWQSVGFSLFSVGFFLFLWGYIFFCGAFLFSVGFSFFCEVFLFLWGFPFFCGVFLFSVGFSFFIEVFLFSVGFSFFLCGFIVFFVGFFFSAVFLCVLFFFLNFLITSKSVFSD